MNQNTDTSDTSTEQEEADLSALFEEDQDTETIDASPTQEGLEELEEAFGEDDNEETEDESRGLAGLFEDAEPVASETVSNEEFLTTSISEDFEQLDDSSYSLEEAFEDVEFVECNDRIGLSENRVAFRDLRHHTVQDTGFCGEDIMVYEFVTVVNDSWTDGYELQYSVEPANAFDGPHTLEEEVQKVDTVEEAREKIRDFLLENRVRETRL